MLIEIPGELEAIALTDNRVVYEHVLKQAITGEALCTVCIRCGGLWWTPYPFDPEGYSPRYCEKEGEVSAGIFVMLNDVKGKAWVGTRNPNK